MFSSDNSTAVHLVNAKCPWVILEKQKRNSQGYAIALRISLKQQIHVLIENMGRDYVPVTPLFMGAESCEKS